MGTRSLTTFIDGKKGQEIVVMYRQFDGYPSGHGLELAEFLAGMLIVNGLTAGQPEKIANGMSCLAAQVVAHFKNEDGVGGIYLYPGGTRDVWEEYIYVVTGAEGAEPNISVRKVIWHNDTPNTYRTLKSGPASQILEWCKTQP